MDWSGHQTAPYRHPVLAGPVPAMCPLEQSRMRPVGGLPAARRHVGHVSGDCGRGGAVGRSPATRRHTGGVGARRSP